MDGLLKVDPEEMFCIIVCQLIDGLLLLHKIWVRACCSTCSRGFVPTGAEVSKICRRQTLHASASVLVFRRRTGGQQSSCKPPWSWYPKATEHVRPVGACFVHCVVHRALCNASLDVRPSYGASALIALTSSLGVSATSQCERRTSEFQ